MSAATEQYLRYMRLSAAESSVTARRRALARMERAIGPLLDVTAGELLAWREGLRQGPGTISNYVAHARGFWAWAAAEGLAGADLAAGLPVPPVPQLLPRPASDEDVLAAVGGAPQPVRVMLVLAGWCGLRAQEIAFLRRSGVLDKADPPAILVTVRAAKGWRERIVPMPPFVLAELAAFGLPPSGWVIGRMDGKPGPNQPHRVSQLCNRYLHEAGIADTLHQWRHWFATGMYHQTKDLRMVQGLLGHASPATTAGYAKYDQAAAAAAAAALPVPGLRSVSLWGARLANSPLAQGPWLSPPQTRRILRQSTTRLKRATSGYPRRPPGRCDFSARDELRRGRPPRCCGRCGALPCSARAVQPPSGADRITG